MLEIIKMTETEIPFAVSMTDKEQWGYLPADFGRLMSFEPEGCFIAKSGDQQIGMITSTSYDSYAFIGSLIVRREERGKGIGEALMNKAIAYLTEKGVETIELDGVFAAVSLYRKLGFRDKYLSLRFARKAADEYGELFPCPAAMADEIISFDKQVTGLNRARLLNDYFGDTESSIYAIVENNVRAYALVRKRAEGVFAFGPLVAINQGYAESLCQALLKKYGSRNLVIGVPEPNSGFAGFLLENGFYYKQPSLRMYLGRKIVCEQYIYGIFSAEKG
ncbi:MAG: GNAT family N-acetyltransferase [Candidatus Zixiibacteriota bacterium]